MCPCELTVPLSLSLSLSHPLSQWPWDWERGIPWSVKVYKSDKCLAGGTYLHHIMRVHTRDSCVGCMRLVSAKAEHKTCISLCSHQRNTEYTQTHLVAY